MPELLKICATFPTFGDFCKHCSNMRMIFRGICPVGHNL